SSVINIAAVMLILNAVVWTALPALLEGSIRLDVAEHVMQGREWLLAYPKHPPLSMWLVDVVTGFGPVRYPALYLLGQILALAGLVAAAFVLRDEGAAVSKLAIL